MAIPAKGSPAWRALEKMGGGRGLAAVVRGMGAGGATLGVKPTAGGNQLFDPGTGAEYATDAAGFYVDSLGARLGVDAGYGVGDAVGALKLYDFILAVVAGTSPAAGGRRNGLGPFSGTDSITIGLQRSAHSFLARVVVSGTSGTQAIAGLVLGVGPGWLLLQVGTTIELRLYSAAGSEIVSARCVLSLPAGTYWVGASTDGASQALHRWDVGGGGHVTATATASTPQTFVAATPYRIGNNTSGALPLTNMSASSVFGWDGSIQSAAAFGDVIAYMDGGGNVDGAKTAYSADLATDGCICVAIDRSNPTALPYIGAVGDGTPVVVAYG